MEPELPPEHASPTELRPCKCCGRNFNQETLARHEGICIKSKQKDATRKPFDSSKHRAKGTDLEAYNVQKKYNKTTDDRLKMIAYERQAQKKKLWKRKHEEFVTAIRSAREYDAATKAGVSLPAPEPSGPNPDYVQCPYCKRRFQEHAAERHIPFCKEQNSRIDHRSQNASSGSSALTKRLKYKPPSIKKRSDADGHSENHHPPGSSLIPRKTNFQATYNVNERSPGSNFYQGERRLNGGPRTYNLANKPPSGNSAAHYPSSNPQGHFKPHPPNKLPPPNRLQGRLGHGIRRTEMANHQGGLTNGYHSGSDEQGDTDYVRKHRTTRKGGGEEEDDNQLYSSSRGSLPKIGNSDSANSQHGDITSNAHPLIGRPQLQDRVNSNSSIGVRSVGSSKHSLLNAHGMTMSKFCYECGSGFPVPQAKYCCECGTKRI